MSVQGRSGYNRCMPGDTDRQLDAHSRQLMDTLTEMKRLEAEKRGSERSTPEFHHLADEVEEKAHEVLELARYQERAGDEDSPLPQDQEDSGPGDWTRHSRG
jgi:hypothetical protein